MTMRAASFVPLCLAALLALAAPAALAKPSQEMPANTGQPAQAEPQSGLETMAKTVKTIAQHNQATAAAAAQAQAEGRPAPSPAQAPAQRSGSSKVIYGDIVIHK